MKAKVINKRFLYSLFLIVLVSACNQTNESTIEIKIKTYLDNLREDDFSGTILVARNDTILEKGTYGFANIEHQIKNKFDTKFNIASISKLITAVGVLKLFEGGKVKLHEPIGTYLPNYPNQEVRNKVTMHQLLTHTSGLNNFYVEEVFSKSDKLQYTKVADFASLFANDTLLFEPGKGYNYSASGFVVLGLIIEKVSGQNYRDYIEKEVFEPANMFNSTELPIDSVVKNKANGYTSLFGENPILKKNEPYLSKASPAGFHYSTAEDLFEFSKALRNENLLNKETLKLMFEPRVKGYNTHLGYGIDIDLRYNQPIRGHSGGWYGVRAELMDFAKNGYTVVILSNTDDNGETGASMVKTFFQELIASD